MRSSEQAAARTAIQRWTKRSQRSQLPRLCTIPSSPQLGARLNQHKIQRTKSKIQKWSIQWWLACPKSKVQIHKFRYQRPHYSLCLAYYVFQAQNWTHVPKCNNPNLFPKFKIRKFPECFASKEPISGQLTLRGLVMINSVETEKWLIMRSRPKLLLL